MIRSKLCKTLLASTLGLCMSTMASADGIVDPFLNALANTPDAKTSEFMSPLQSGVQWVANLPPTSGMMVVKLENGQHMIIDGNFKYAFYANNVMDLVRGEEITEMDQINNVWEMETSKLNSKDLPIFSYGVEKPKADLFVFMDMQKGLAATDIVEYIKLNQDKYRIDVVLVGGTDKVKLNSAANLFCAKDRKQAKANLLELKLPVKDDSTTWLDIHPTCTVDYVFKSSMMAHMYNITRFPAVVNSKGVILNGLPKDLERFVTYENPNPSNGKTLSELTNGIKK